MNREELLDQVKSLIAKGELSKSELLQSQEQASTPRYDAVKRWIDIRLIFYYLGAVLISLSIYAFTLENIDSNLVAIRTITLGSAAGAYALGVLFWHYRKKDGLWEPFHLVASMASLAGFFILIGDFFSNMSSSWQLTVLFSALLVLSLISLVFFRKNLFAFLLIAAGTGLFLSVMSFFMPAGLSLRELSEEFVYRGWMVGLGYMLIGYATRRTARQSLSWALYGLGSLLFIFSALYMAFSATFGELLEAGSLVLFLLIAQFTSTFSADSGDLVWQLLFPFFAVGVLVLSVLLKSRSFLLFGFTGLVIYVIGMTFGYLRDDLGWPLSLFIIGAAIVAVSYGSFYLNRQHMASQ